ncbi:uncharacterized protein [Littorina saxatilis]|uniref:Transcription termination factor, mitochondrial n=1 Tax=Littorina saxatilis TaxID=31220 RepID=A0AAN9G2F8_9CAEN
MALRKLACPLVDHAFGWIRPWQLQAAAFIPTAKTCVSISSELQYSRKQVPTDEELQVRAKFLATQFHSSEGEMQHFLSSNSRLVSMGKNKFYSLTQLLAQHGISMRELLIYPNVYRRKYETVANRIRQLEEGGVKPVTLRMINTTYKKYQAKYGRLMLDTEVYEQFKSSIDLLSSQLGLSEKEAEDIISESKWLNNTKMSTLKDKIELLWSYGISSEAIRERMWVLAFPTDTLRSRIEALKKSGINFKDFPKQYLIAIKSSDDKFKKFQERLLEDKTILDQSGCSDKAAYICSRLSCSEVDLVTLCKKFRALLSVRLPKLKTNLDVLLKEFGVPKSVIVESPRALRLSTETLRERLQQLQDLEVPVSGRALNMSNAQYEQFMERLKEKGSI